MIRGYAMAPCASLGHPVMARPTTPTVPTPASARAARWWLGLCFLGNALLEVLSWARGTDALRQAWPLLIGSGPNGAAVLAIAGAAVAILLLQPPAVAARWPVGTQVHGVLMGTVIGLLVWEGVQPWTARGVFDVLDAMTTVGTGAVLAFAWPRLRQLDPREPPVDPPRF